MSSLNLNITSLCNLKCYWCHNQSQHGTGLEVNKFNRFFENIIKDHISCVTLIGGEPTVHPEFFDFLEILKINIYILLQIG